MTENHVLANSAPSTENAVPSAAKARWQHSNIRHQIVVGLVVIAIAVGIVFTGHRTLVRHALMLETATTVTATSAEYKAGMQLLNNPTTSTDLNKIKHLFIQALRSGDTRGSYGLACVLYQRDLGRRYFPDSLAGHAYEDRKELAIINLKHAANHGSLTALAALISYDQEVLDPEINRHVGLLLAAAKNPVLANQDDPALPELSADERKGTDAMAYTIKLLLNQGMCAPPLSNGLVRDVIRNAVRGSKP